MFHSLPTPSPPPGQRQRGRKPPGNAAVFPFSARPARPCEEEGALHVDGHGLRKVFFGDLCHGTHLAVEGEEVDAVGLSPGRRDVVQ